MLENIGRIFASGLQRLRCILKQLMAVASAQSMEEKGVEDKDLKTPAGTWNSCSVSIFPGLRVVIVLLTALKPWVSNACTVGSIICHRAVLSNPALGADQCKVIVS